MPDFRYTLFGLNLLSEMALPELRVSSVADTDVEIRWGHGAGERTIAVEVDGVARYDVSDGRSVHISPADEAIPAQIRLFLLGTAIGVLLHQRGDFPLHANCLSIQDKAFAFAGQSGAGKSTLAAWMRRRGAKVLGDDVCVIRMVPTGPVAFPGIARLRLWDDALAADGTSSNGLEPSFPGDPSYRKFDLPLSQDEVAGDGAQLAAIYVLTKAGEFSIEPMQPMEAVEALFAHTYRGEYVAVAGSAEKHWSTSLAIARSIPVFRLQRSMLAAAMDEENRRLLDHLHALTG